MTKQGKLLPARRQRVQPQDEDSILVRSAESIGRVIGTLQRQLDTARNQIATSGGNGNPGSRTNHSGEQKGKTKKSGVKGVASVARAGGAGRKSSTSLSASSSHSTTAAARRRASTKTSRTTRRRKASKPR